MSDTNVTINITGGNMVTEDILEAVRIGNSTEIVRINSAQANAFSITKEQYDKDIAQAKKDAVADHCKKMSEAIQKAMHEAQEKAYQSLFKS